MSHRSPIHSDHDHTVFVCGKLLQPGQSILVDECAVGPREDLAIKSGRVVKHVTLDGMMRLVVVR